MPRFVLDQAGRLLNQTPGLTAMETHARTYGWKADAYGDDWLFQHWTPTGDPESLALPDLAFIPEADKQAVLAALQRRHPCPERAGQIGLIRVWGGHGDVVTVCRYPCTKRVREQQDPAGVLRPLVLEYGAVLIEPPPHGRYWGSGGEHDVARDVRAGASFHDSDLVLTDLRGYLALVQNERMAKARRTRAAGTGERRRKAEEKKKAEEARKKAERAKAQLVEALYEAAWVAAKEMWAAVPGLSAVGMASFITSRLWASDNYSAGASPIGQFFRHVRFNEGAVGKGRWRALPAVTELFLKYAPAARAHVGNAAYDRWHDLHDPEHLAWFWAEADRARRVERRRLAREARTREGADGVRTTRGGTGGIDLPAQADQAGHERPVQ